MIRQVLNLDRRTHRYLIEGLSEMPHWMNMLYGRLNKFYNSMKRSPKFVVRYLAVINEDDHRTAFGRNIYFMNSETNNNPNKTTIKDSMKYFRIPEEEDWRVGVGLDLLRVKNGDYDLEEFTRDEINDLMTVICIS